jgi:superfamily I DNA/RNA helicase
VTDVDGNTEERNAPSPMIRSLDDEKEEIAAVGRWIRECAEAGMLPHEIGLFVRSDAQMDRARDAAKAAGVAFKVLDEQVETAGGHLSIGTMHLAKGLEFRAVAVMACDDEIIPLQERIETVDEDADLQDVYDTERHLLYVACTRARDRLLISGVLPTSEFLDDLREPERR